MSCIQLSFAGHARELVRAAALDQKPIRGLTHTFYRYPARFSPTFARACIQTFSEYGDVVLDPYVGGGTTVVEAMVLGRRAIGSDINSLAVFVTEVKVSELLKREQRDIARWTEQTVRTLKCNVIGLNSGWNPRNMSSPEVRWLRKTISMLLASIESELRTTTSRRFARCAVLNVGQWALNGRKRVPTAAEFRERIILTTTVMLAGANSLSEALSQAPVAVHTPVLRENDAEAIYSDPEIIKAGPADLVVTSPPYPGIHMLYHRWQVDGRKETDAPFWIAARKDGAGAAFYNFADRRAEDSYFDKAERSFAAIRRVMRLDATLVQIVAFSDPTRQLARYLAAMSKAGFVEDRCKHQRRIRRNVPGRHWHANLKGNLASSREVVLVHKAI